MPSGRQPAVQAKEKEIRLRRQTLLINSRPPHWILPSHWYHAQYIDIDIEINADVDFDIEIDIDIDIDIDADIDIEIDADVDFDIVDMLPLINSRPPP